MIVCLIFIKTLMSYNINKDNPLLRVLITVICFHPMSFNTSSLTSSFSIPPVVTAGLYSNMNPCDLKILPVHMFTEAMRKIRLEHQIEESAASVIMETLHHHFKSETWKCIQESHGQPLETYETPMLKLAKKTCQWSSALKVLGYNLKWCWDTLPTSFGNEQCQVGKLDTSHRPGKILEMLAWQGCAEYWNDLNYEMIKSTEEWLLQEQRNTEDVVRDALKASGHLLVTCDMVTMLSKMETHLDSMFSATDSKKNRITQGRGLKKYAVKNIIVLREKTHPYVVLSHGKFGRHFYQKGTHTGENAKEAPPVFRNSIIGELCLDEQIAYLKVCAHHNYGRFLKSKIHHMEVIFGSSFLRSQVSDNQNGLKALDVYNLNELLFKYHIEPFVYDIPRITTNLYSLAKTGCSDWATPRSRGLRLIGNSQDNDDNDGGVGGVFHGLGCDMEKTFCAFGNDHVLAKALISTTSTVQYREEVPNGGRLNQPLQLTLLERGLEEFCMELCENPTVNNLVTTKRENNINRNDDDDGDYDADHRHRDNKQSLVVSTINARRIRSKVDRFKRLFQTELFYAYYQGHCISFNSTFSGNTSRAWRTVSDYPGLLTQQVHSKRWGGPVVVVHTRADAPLATLSLRLDKLRRSAFDWWGLRLKSAWKDICDLLIDNGSPNDGNIAFINKLANRMGLATSSDCLDCSLKDPIFNLDGNRTNKWIFQRFILRKCQGTNQGPCSFEVILQTQYKSNCNFKESGDDYIKNCLYSECGISSCNVQRRCPEPRLLCLRKSSNHVPHPHFKWETLLHRKPIKKLLKACESQWGISTPLSLLSSSPSDRVPFSLDKYKNVFYSLSGQDSNFPERCIFYVPDDAKENWFFNKSNKTKETIVECPKTVFSEIDERGSCYNNYYRAYHTNLVHLNLMLTLYHDTVIPTLSLINEGIRNEELEVSMTNGEKENVEGKGEGDTNAGYDLVSENLGNFKLQKPAKVTTSPLCFLPTLPKPFFHTKTVGFHGTNQMFEGILIKEPRVEETPETTLLAKHLSTLQENMSQEGAYGGNLIFTTEWKSCNVSFENETWDALSGVHLAKCRCSYCSTLQMDLCSVVGCWYSLHDKSTSTTYTSHLYGTAQHIINRSASNSKVTQNYSDDSTMDDVAMSVIYSNFKGNGNPLELEEAVTKAATTFQTECCLPLGVFLCPPRPCKKELQACGTVPDDSLMSGNAGLTIMNDQSTDRPISRSYDFVKWIREASKYWNISPVQLINDLNHCKSLVHLYTLLEYSIQFMLHFQYRQGALIPLSQQLQEHTTPNIVNDGDTARDLQGRFIVYMEEIDLEPCVGSERTTPNTNGPLGDFLYGHHNDMSDSLEESDFTSDDDDNGDDINNNGRFVEYAQVTYVERYEFVKLRLHGLGSVNPPMAAECRMDMSRIVYSKYFESVAPTCSFVNGDHLFALIDEANSEVKLSQTFSKWILKLAWKMANLDFELNICFQDLICLASKNLETLNVVNDHPAYIFLVNFVCWVQDLHVKRGKVNRTNVPSKIDTYTTTHFTQPVKRRITREKYHYKGGHVATTDPAVYKCGYKPEEVHKLESKYPLLPFGALVYRSFCNLEKETYGIVSFCKRLSPDSFLTKDVSSCSPQEVDAFFIMDMLSKMCIYLVPIPRLWEKIMTQTDPNRDSLETKDSECASPQVALRIKTEDTRWFTESTEPNILDYFDPLSGKSHTDESLKHCKYSRVMMCCTRRLKPKIGQLYDKLGASLNNYVVAQFNVVPSTQEFQSKSSPTIGMHIDEPTQNLENRARPSKRKHDSNDVHLQEIVDGHTSPNKRIKKNCYFQTTTTMPNAPTTSNIDHHLPKMTVFEVITHLYFHNMKLVKNQQNLPEQTVTNPNNNYYETKTNICWNDLRILPPPLEYDVNLEDVVTNSFANVVQPFLY